MQIERPLLKRGRRSFCESILEDLSAQYDSIISWADLYDNTSMEAKKMIFSYLINRVEVFRGYKVNIDFNIDLEQFHIGDTVQEASPAG